MELQPKKLLNKAEVATLFGVTTRTVNVWLANRLLPHFRQGHVLRFRPDDIEAVIARKTVPAIGAPKRRMGRIAEAQPIQPTKDVIV